VSVLLAEVVGIEDGAVLLDDGSRLGFDRLALAAGRTTPTSVVTSGNPTPPG
jgi:hypothetical protein